MADADEIITQAKEELERERELLRPVAEFFHDHEGEMFERYEAVDALIEADGIPSTDERLLHKVTNNLASDSVDPVQSVVTDDGKYIGVIEYDEHDYWYEYVESDDVRGRQNVGICAQCVKEAENDADVAKGIGTTKELAQRVRSHYRDEHTESPDNVSTGATLVSGTTIGGNTAIHTGNDGVGSNLDADTARGTDSSGLVRPGVTYEVSDESGLVLKQFTQPCVVAFGVDTDSNSSVWTTDEFANSIYEHRQDGTVLSKFSSPSDNPRGIEFDSNDSIWHADYTSGSVYQLDKSGGIQQGFSSPAGTATGVGLDGAESIWHTDSGADSIYKLDKSGSIQKTIASPDLTVQGITVDSEGCLWHISNGGSTGYKTLTTGRVLKSFNVPDSDSGGLGSENDCLWTASDSADSIYKLLSDALSLTQG
jgi:hypothetical protein